MERKTVTMAEIGSRLGVSSATVAKALHGKGRISAEMVEKIKAVAKELKYVPNTAARALRTNVKDAVGVLITLDIVNPWYSQLVSSLEEELSARGLSMLLGLAKGDLRKAKNAMPNFLGGRIKGLLAGPLFSRADLAFVEEAIDFGLPVVAFNSLEELPLNVVDINQAAGAKLAVEHLVELGHRRIVYLGSPSSVEAQVPSSRYAGFTSAMKASGLEPLYVSAEGPVSRRAGYQLAEFYLDHQGADRATAFFCHNDDLALGAMLAFQQRGLRVPEDLSVIGFDDIEESTCSHPSLTTVGGVMNELAHDLVDLLEQVADSDEVIRKQLIEPKLIVRESTGRA